MTDQNHPSPEQDIVERAIEHRTPTFDPTGKIEDIMDNEVMLFDVRRHPIGMLFLYIQIITAVTLSVGIIILFIPSISDVFGLSSNTLDAIAVLLALAMIAFTVIFLIISTRIYDGNQLMATDKNITLISQISLFNRKVSELSMASIEDVTARQNGILQTMFNYGSLTVETAGEQNNFIFNYCPNPNAYAKAILDARTNFIVKNGE